MIIEVIRNIREMQQRADLLRQKGKTIVFVPTMGFLHEGHLSLFRIGRARGDYLIASIFVNPTQFAAGEDLETYPRNFKGDLDLSEKENVDLVFAPEAKTLYPENYQTYVQLEKLPDHLCGISRPTFFRGVATIVTKLFHIVKPHVAVFGEKDFQQLAVIRQMVKDMNMDIEIIGAPTAREADGLAMSSRNSYLTPPQRESAVCLNRALQEAQALVDSGLVDSAGIIEKVSRLIESRPETKIDYISICNPQTLDDIESITEPALMALAVYVGKTRLIDNTLLLNGKNKSSS